VTIVETAVRTTTSTALDAALGLNGSAATAGRTSAVRGHSGR
jgi:hypothetical protein